MHSKRRAAPVVAAALLASIFALGTAWAAQSAPKVEYTPQVGGRRRT